MVSSLGEQMGEWWQLADDLTTGVAQQEVLRKTGRTVKGEALANFARVAGSDLALANFPRRKRAKPLKASVFYKGKSGKPDNLVIKFRPFGLWGLVEGGAKPHKIGAKRGKRAILAFKDGGFATGPVNHPGSRALGKPAQRAIAEIGPTFDGEMAAYLARRVL